MATNTSSTKAELRAHIAGLEAQLIARGRELGALRTQLSVATRNAPSPHVQRSLPLGFQRAREAAMASGKSVKVAT